MEPRKPEGLDEEDGKLGYCLACDNQAKLGDQIIVCDFCPAAFHPQCAGYGERAAVGAGRRAGQDGAVPRLLKLHMQQGGERWLGVWLTAQAILQASLSPTTPPPLPARARARLQRAWKTCRKASGRAGDARRTARTSCFPPTRWVVCFLSRWLDVLWGALEAGGLEAAVGWQESGEPCVQRCGRLQWIGGAAVEAQPRPAHCCAILMSLHAAAPAPVCLQLRCKKGDRVLVAYEDPGAKHRQAAGGVGVFSVLHIVMCV